VIAVAHPKGLPAGRSPWLIERESCVRGIPQPLWDFFCLDRPVSSSRSRLRNSVISSAVPGFRILFDAREMCSSRRRREFGLLRISASCSRQMSLAYPYIGSRSQHANGEGASRNSKSSHARRQQLANQIPNRKGLVLSGAETLRATLATLSTCSMKGTNFPASSGIASILHLDPDWRVSYVVQTGGFASPVLLTKHRRGLESMLRYPNR